METLEYTMISEGKNDFRGEPVVRSGYTCICIVPLKSYDHGIPQLWFSTRNIMGLSFTFIQRAAFCYWKKSIRSERERSLVCSAISVWLSNQQGRIWYCVSKEREKDERSVSLPLYDRRQVIDTVPLWLHNLSLAVFLLVLYSKWWPLILYCSLYSIAFKLISVRSH